MGHQGAVRKQSELKRVAAHFGVHWTQVQVQCWRDNDVYWVSVDNSMAARVYRDTLRPAPLNGWARDNSL